MGLKQHFRNTQAWYWLHFRYFQGRRETLLITHHNEGDYVNGDILQPTPYGVLVYLFYYTIYDDSSAEECRWFCCTKLGVSTTTSKIFLFNNINKLLL